MYVRECFAYVLLQEFYSFWSYIQIFNPFWVYFCVQCQKVFQFHSFTVVDQFSQHHLLKRLSFLYCIFLPLLSWIRCLQCVDLSLGFLFCSIDLYFCLCAVPYCLDDCSFVVQSAVRQVDSSSSILLSQDCFSYSRIFLYFLEYKIVKLFVLVL